MKLTSLFLAMTSATTMEMIPDIDSVDMTIEAKWTQFKKQFNKAGSTGFEAFKSNDAIIQEHNAKGLSWWLGHNQFSDLTWDEFKGAGYVGKPENFVLDREMNYDYSLLNQTAPLVDIDWVAKGAVTPVKNQAQCGSCWAFSTTGSFEGAFQIGGNPLTSFSEQDLVSCDNAAGGGTDQGCNGGLMDNAFTWIKKNGLCLEKDYPYTSGGGQSGTCKKTCKPAATLTGFTDVPKGSDPAGMLAGLAKGPVSVAIEADKSAFQLYKGGVLDNPACGNKLDHGVLAVGYGTDGKDYYKVKNSWGATWGEAGYIRMVRAKDQCGIADSASYPTGVKSMGPPGPGPSPGPGPAPGPGPEYKCAEVKQHTNCDGYPKCTWCDVAGNSGCYSKEDAGELPKDISKCDAGPGPAPGPSPPGPSPGPGTCHYEDPSGGCQSDEKAVQVTGVQGSFCSPDCTSAACPTDVCSGVTAKPQCALQSSTGTTKNCALLCSPSTDEASLRAGDAQCGEKASCKAIQTVGICTYDSR